MDLDTFFLRSIPQASSFKRFILDATRGDGALSSEESSSDKKLYLKMDHLGVIDSYSFRNVHFTILIADYLIDEKGALNFKHYHELRKLLESIDGFSSGYEDELLRIAQIRRVLKWLDDGEICQRLFAIRPMRSPLTDQVIQQTLSALPYYKLGETVTDRSARVAVLSAWMSYLRQNVGSCFATAPAIVIHSEQPEYFLDDMTQIITKGSLTRVIEGHEFTVPMCKSWGSGEFRKRVYMTPELVSDPSLKYIAKQVCSRIDDKTRTSQEALDEESKGSKFNSSEVENLLKSLFEEELLGMHYVSLQEIVSQLICRLMGLNLSELSHVPDKKKSLEITLAHTYSSAGRNQSLNREGNKGSSSWKIQTYENLINYAAALCTRLSDNALLKCWEFSLASFSETRHDFCRWNMYTSLGMNTDQEEGIAHKLYELIDRRLQRANQICEETLEDLNQMTMRLNHSAQRLQTARDDQEVSWQHSEYRSVKAEYDQLNIELKQQQQRAQKLADLYPALLDRYDKLFPDYFQEVYDPHLRVKDPQMYEDSPAGFRLVFKGGRFSTALWKEVEGSCDYIDTLVQFFTITESLIADEERFKGLSIDISRVITALIQHVRSPIFLKSAYQRLALQRGLDISHVDLSLLARSGYTPWSFISGGTMTALLSHYYGRMDPPSEKKVNPASVEELWVFMIDTLRDLPQWKKERILGHKTLPLLMHSKDHAFTLRPGLSRFSASWNNEVYPYTWIRDYFVEPSRELYSKVKLERDEQQRLLTLLVSRYPVMEKFCRVASEALWETLSPSGFFQKLETFAFRSGYKQLWEQVISTAVEGVLWESIPLFDRISLQQRLQDLLMEQYPHIVDSFSEDQVKGKISDEVFRHPHERFFASETFACAIKILQNLWGSLRNAQISLWDLKDTMSRYELIPFAIPFADSNWQRDYFGFVVSPVTETLQIWRTQPLSLRGVPFKQWNYFHAVGDASSPESDNASKKASQGAFWGIFDKTEEYKII